MDRFIYRVPTCGPHTSGRIRPSAGRATGQHEVTCRARGHRPCGSSRTRSAGSTRSSGTSRAPFGHDRFGADIGKQIITLTTLGQGWKRPAPIAGGPLRSRRSRSSGEPMTAVEAGRVVRDPGPASGPGKPGDGTVRARPGPGLLLGQTGRLAPPATGSRLDLSPDRARSAREARPPLDIPHRQD